MNDTTESTFVMLKPDCVRRGLVRAVLDRIETAGLSFKIIDVLTLSDATIGCHYATHIGKEFYPALLAFTKSGPVVQLRVTGPNAISAMRTLIGTTDPNAAAPGTIRADFNERSGIVRHNLIHASDSAVAAEYELGLHEGAAARRLTEPTAVSSNP